MKVIIAEKPSFAKAISEALTQDGERFQRKDGYLESKNYYITWQFGHLFELYTIEEYEKRQDKKWIESLLPYFPTEFKFKLKENSGIKKQFSIIRELINRENVTEVVESGDSDAEGSLLLQLSTTNIYKRDKINKPRTRLWSTDQSANTILESLHNLKSVDEYKTYAASAYARSCMDFLLGVNLTRKMTLMNSRITGAKELFSVGRCNTSIVNFIYDRDKEIAMFKPTIYKQLESNEKTNDELIKLIDKDKFELAQEKELKEKLDYLNSQTAIVRDIQSKKIKKSAPKLFSLTSLQGLLSSKYKIGMEESLIAIQKMYEAGYVSYPRTGSRYLSTEEIPKVKRILKAHDKEGILVFKETKDIFNNEKIESHSALIITDKIPDQSKLSEIEKIIYTTIKNRFISNFLKEETIIGETIMNIEVGEYIYPIKGEVIIQRGFYNYEPLPKSKERNTLPNLKEGDKVNIRFNAIEKQTSPPKKLTVESLMKILENPLGKKYKDEESEIADRKKGISIGTDATRTGLIENIKKYGYVIDSNGTLSITNKGKYLVETLKKLNINITKDKTIEFSKILKDVLNGKKNPNEAIKITEKELRKMFEDIKEDSCDLKGFGKREEREVIGICPRCGGKVFEGPKSFYCENALLKDEEKKCPFSLYKENKFFTSKGKHISKTTAKKLLKDNQVKMKGLMKKDNKGTYDAIIVMVLTDKYTNFELKFENKK